MSSSTVCMMSLESYYCRETWDKDMSGSAGMFVPFGIEWFCHKNFVSEERMFLSQKVGYNITLPEDSDTSSCRVRAGDSCAHALGVLLFSSRTHTINLLREARPISYSTTCRCHTRGVLLRLLCFQSLPGVSGSVCPTVCPSFSLRSSLFSMTF